MRITRNEGKLFHSGVGTDKEIRERQRFSPTAPAVVEEALSGQERRFPWNWTHFEYIRRQQGLKFFDACKADRDFRINYRVKNDGARIGGICQDFGGPVKPVVIVGENIQKDTRIHHHRHQRRLRVSRMISSVVILTVPWPAIRLTKSVPRPESLTFRRYSLPFSS